MGLRLVKVRFRIRVRVGVRFRVRVRVRVRDLNLKPLTMCRSWMTRDPSLLPTSR